MPVGASERNHGCKRNRAGYLLCDPMTTALKTPDSAAVTPAQHAPAAPTPEVSVVIPCLNEALSIASCVDKAFAALEAEGIRGEVVVSDNGSTDGSVEIAEAH